MVELKEWERHVLKDHKKDPKLCYCGYVAHYDWVYMNKEHVFNSIERDRVQPCPECFAKISDEYEEFKKSKMAKKNGEENNE
jgi:hypothetical protein